MIGEYVWGPVPAGFKKICPNPGQRIVVHARLAPYVDGSRFFDEISSAQAASPFRGRGRIGAYRLDNGETALVRAYHHGGMLRHLNGEFFFTWPPRPFKELAVTEQVRRRGVPTPELLGACVDRVWGPFYRGWLMSRELEGGQDLWAALQSERYRSASRESLLEAVADSLRTMHRRGVYHSDLNLKNILVRLDHGRVQGYIIDLDKARLFPAAVPSALAEKNLRRLLRSACKLDPERTWLPPKDWDLLVQCYREDGQP